MNAPEIRSAFADLKQKQPKLRARDAARALGISEAALLASRVGDDVTLLRPEFSEIFAALASLGEVMALTRNESAVHEKWGTYPAPIDTPPSVLFHDPAIDLRIFPSAWDSAFALRELAGDKERRSLQFFGKDGEAVHKVWLGERSDVGAFERLVDRFASDGKWRPGEPPAPRAPERPDESIQVPALREAWAALQDTHDFFPMLRRFEVGRLQALRLAGDDFARQVGNGSTRAVLERAAATDLPIMVFVGSPGCIQIHSGPVKRVVVMGPWLNVLDGGFNLHLREDRVHTSWVVVKPTAEGPVHALELFDEDGELIALFFGVRERHLTEDPQWRALLADVEAEHGLVD